MKTFARTSARWLAPAVLIASSAVAQEGEEPEEERGLRINAEGAYQGYTLFAPLSSRSIYLIDMDGEVVHTWETSMSPTGAVYLKDNGNLLTCGRPDESPVFHGGGIGGWIQEIAWDGTVVWDYRMADEFRMQHHDIEPMPNGNVLMIAWEHRYRDDAVAFGRDPETLSEEGLWPDAVFEVKPVLPDGGEIVWEWHAWDHLVQDFDESAQNYGSVAANPGLIDINGDHRDQPPMTEEEIRAMEELEEQMRALGYVGGDDTGDDRPASAGGAGPDWLHTNAVAYHPEHDLIVLSVPRMNELWIIDHGLSTRRVARNVGGRWGRGGSLLWRWGNPRTYGRGTDADQALFFQHNATWIDGPNGDLRLLVYNNGGGRSDGDYSSVDELVLPFHPDTGFRLLDGQAFEPVEPVWSYADRDNFFSGFISGAERLPNGNTLICEGARGRAFEVTPTGEIVWEYLNEHSGDVPQHEFAGNAPTHALFRATRIAPDHPGLVGRL